MSKQAGMSKVLAVVVLILLTMGVGWCLVHPKLVDVKTFFQNQNKSAFEEQARLSAEYEQALQQKIIQTLESLTGPDTVRATVRIQLNWADETIIHSSQKQQISVEEKTHSMMNEVKSVSVNVLIDGAMVQNKRGRQVYQPRTTLEMKQYQEIVKAVIGFDSKRGDKINIQNVPFVGPKTVVAGYSVAQIGRWVSGGCWCLLLVILIFGVILPYLKRMTRADEGELQEKTSVPLKKVNELCCHHPEDVAQLMKRWLSVDGPKIGGYTRCEAVAIIILSLSKGTAKNLFSFLSDGDIRKIGRQISRLGRVPAADIQKVLTQFLKEYRTPSVIVGNQEQLKELFQQITPKSQQLLSEIALENSGHTVWEKMAQLDKMQLVHFLQNKKPEMVALILYHLSDSLSAQVISLLPEELRTRALIHLSHIRHLKAEVLQKMVGDIVVSLNTFLGDKNKESGADKIAKILRTISAHEQEKWVDEVLKQSKEVGGRIQASLIQWDDLAHLSEKQMIYLLKHIDQGILTRALSISDDKTRTAFQKYIPEGVYASMAEKFKGLASQKERALEAQKLILKTVEYLKLF